jgi:hypothetical protein
MPSLRRKEPGLAAATVAGAALALLPPLFGASPERPAPAWTHEVGLEVDLSAAGELAGIARDTGTDGRGLVALTPLDLEDAAAQDPALETIAAALRTLRGIGVRPVVSLHFSGRSLPGPAEPERMRSWEQALAALARLGESDLAAVTLVLPEDLEAASLSAVELGYLIKRTSVALRTVRRDLAVLLDLPTPLERLLAPLLAEDVGPYVDGVCLAAPPEAEAEWVRGQAQDLFRLRPGMRLLTRGWSASSPEAAVLAYLRAVGAGASGVLFGEIGADGAEAWQVLARLREQVPDRMPPAPAAKVRFLGADGAEVRVEHGHFFDPEAFEAVVWYRSDPGAPAKVEAVVGTSDATAPAVFDPLSGDLRWVSLWVPDRKTRTTRFDVPLRQAPLLMHYRREIGSAGERGDLSVERERIPPVEEILARHQEFQAAQDRRLRRWIADATIELHYSVGTAGANFDLTYKSRLYADPEGTTEWEHRSLEFNGAPYRGKKLPDLPYVLPERVVEVPLRLTLNKDYTYRLVGRDGLDGVECWLVEFEPVDPARRLYRGRVWIDSRTYARRRLSAVQTAVESPLISVEDDLRFEPIDTGDGPLWVLSRARGQQVITISGRNLILVRELTFRDFQINPADFEARREAALASPAFIVRESERGYETLIRRDDGTREARPSGIQKTLMLLGGVFYNEAVSVPVPLAGVNYFDFKAGGRNLHLEVFAAGAFNFANLTDPDFLGTKWEVGADLVTRAFPLTDRYLRSEEGGEGEEIEAFGVDDITQGLSFNAGRPLGPFLKFTGFYEIEYARYSRDEDTRAAFVTPSDTFVHALEARLDFDRRGTSVRIFGRAARRSRWEPWGFPDAALPALGPEASAPGFGLGSLLEEFDPDARDYIQYGASVSRLWTPGLLTTLRGEAAWMQGEDLDRFSKFQFSSLGSLRLQGFGGSGVRFDQGGIARGTYTFKVGPLLRLDASLEHARVRDRALGRRDYLGFTGAGLAGNFTLPAGWVVRLGYGVGLDADLQDRKGEHELLLVLMKIL